MSIKEHARIIISDDNKKALPLLLYQTLYTAYKLTAIVMIVLVAKILTVMLPPNSNNMQGILVCLCILTALYGDVRLIVWLLGTYKIKKYLRGGEFDKMVFGGNNQYLGQGVVRFEKWLMIAFSIPVILVFLVFLLALLKS